jgi:hypothetical protein
MGAYIYLVERPRMAEEGREDLLVHLDPAEVGRLVLRYSDKPTITVVREGEDWRMTEPLATQADDGQVERLLEQIAKTTAERRIPAAEAENLDVYGLEGDGTHARISIELDDGTSLPDIVVGRTTPVGYQAFARLDGHDDVVVTPLIFHTGVNKTVFDLRDKKLFPVDTDDAKGQSRQIDEERREDRGDSRRLGMAHDVAGLRPGRCWTDRGATDRAEEPAGARVLRPIPGAGP